MRYKRFMIMLVLAVFALSVAGVCASDVATAVESSADDSIIEVDDVQAIGENENEEIVSEGNVGTFSDLRQKIQDAGDDNTITLDRDYEADDSGKIDFSYSRLVIDGKGHKIDAKKQTKIFIVRGSNVTIKNITFTNSQDTAIGWYGADGKITDCNFINNTAGANGGAIYWGASGGSVSGCSFIGNTAWSTGGAIFWFGGSGSVSGCSFINNTATSGGGGAIYWFDESGSVSGCSFINNTAELGGAIYWNGDGGSVSGCSFIGNTARRGGAISIPASRYLPANYCWFGNDASNYKDPLPISGQVNCTYWLFLNSTVNPDNIPLFGTSDIAFKLFLYNSTSGNTSDYDNSLFEYLNLTITPNNGNVDKSVAKMGDTIKYTGTSGGNNIITVAIMDNIVTQVNINVDKISPDFSAEGQIISYGENAIITLNYNNMATGKVNITLTGKKGTFTYLDLDLNATIMLPNDIPSDEYNVTVSYSGDDNFFNATANATLTVNKAGSVLSSKGLTTTYHDYKYLIVNLKDDNGNPITNVKANITINGVTYNCPVDENGDAELIIRLNPGTYETTVTLDNGNYNKTTIKTQVVVKKATPKLTAKAKTFKVKTKTKKYSVTLKDNLGKAIKKAKITLKVKGKTYKATTNSKGKATFKITKLTKKGTFKATVTYKGNKYYTKATKKVKIKIK